MSNDSLTVAGNFKDLIDECAEVLEDATISGLLPSTSPAITEGLLARSLDLTSGAVSEPPLVRTIHHFACSGGTLISKVLAAMPNTLLLSEVEPHSTQVAIKAKKTAFAPTDLISLLRASSRGGDPKLESRIFLAGLREIIDDCQGRGLRLILRDHAHSRFCFGAEHASGPSLRDLVRNRYEVKSILTVRHPLDSFLSLDAQNWRHFAPFTLSEYADRYVSFLECYSDLTVFRYEDFVAQPNREAQKMCLDLRLPYWERATELFSANGLSGDSGRSSDVIEVKSRRKVPETIAEERRTSRQYAALCERLEYSP